VSYDGAVKLVDFGIARAGSQPAQTRGGLKGKIAYMSPEQCRGKTALDRRSDVFSIGTILYELTTGKLPFTDETEYDPGHDREHRRGPTDHARSGIHRRSGDVMLRPPIRIGGTRPRSSSGASSKTSPTRTACGLAARLARLMSALFPARLEKWITRAQGAFFVEQHVVRTLIERRPASLPRSVVSDASHSRSCRRRTLGASRQDDRPP
jgi:serine/threonine protein kinase